MDTITYMFHQIYFLTAIKLVMGRACGACGEGERGVQGSGGET